MKPNYPAGEAAAEARAVDPRQRVRHLLAAMAEGARRAGPPGRRLPLTRTPLPRQHKEES
jgi:hypothetical protein